MADQPNSQNQFFNPLAVQSPPAAPTPVSEPPKKKAIINKKILLIGFLLLFLAGLIYAVNKFTHLFSKASGECAPQNVKSVDQTANSVDIIFQTDTTCQAEIAYGTGNQPEALLLLVPEAMASLNHRVRLSPLLPSTTYYYQIKFEGKPTGEIYSFLTSPPTGGTAPLVTKSPTAAPKISPTAVPTALTPTVGVSVVYTFEEFQAKFGSTNTAFDIDKNGVVNVRDWFEYQKSHP